VRAALLNFADTTDDRSQFRPRVGVLFLVLAVQGRLAGPFPFLAGWGDIITGVFAVLLLSAAADENIQARSWHGTSLARPISFSRFSSVSPRRKAHRRRFLLPLPAPQRRSNLRGRLSRQCSCHFWLILPGIIWAQLRMHTKLSHSANAVA